MNRCYLFSLTCLFLVIGAACSLSCSLSAQQPDAPDLSARVPAAADREIDFVADVQPILREHCFECHSDATEEGGLNLAVKARAMQGGEHGPVVVPGEAMQSTLLQLVAGLDEDRLMPPEGNDRLSPEQIGVLRAWIKQGANWPDGTDAMDPRLERGRHHWAFQPLRSIDLPLVDGTKWPQTATDIFIARKLAENQLTPSPQASAETLVRRLYFDLHGLPPTPKQVDEFHAAFESNPRAAVTDLVDQLLQQHHYGERWARHWLDVARFAESDGPESDRARPHAYRSRALVVQAFNEDMPYDQFVRWQIAGDEYQPENDHAVAATGFLTAGPSFKLEDTFLEQERLLNRYNELDDIISTLGTGMLGLTVGCARCHDHKYDAFSAREYYQLMSVFHSGDRVAGKLPSGEDGFFFQDFDSEVRTTWLFRRSDFYDREIEVTLGFPAILSGQTPAEAYWETAKSSVSEPNSTLQRRALADWITDVDQGSGALLARVMVNRIWQHHFGYGLVRTESDFGVRGEPPTHPELLEYLANDFVSGGWKVKRLHRQILLSAVWQQTSHPKSSSDATSDRGWERGMEVDPQNRLLWKMTPQRLEAEILRDAMLSVSGTLHLQAGGPSFKPYIPPEAKLARNIQGGDYPDDAVDDHTTRRRSVYMFHKRLVPYPLFQAFDRPDLLTSCARRQNTTVAPQSLALLNDRFVRAVAVDFAKRLVESAGDDDRRVVRESFRLAFSRSPTEAESDASVAFLQAQTKSRSVRGDRNAHLQSIADFCQSLFGLNEFLYVD